MNPSGLYKRNLRKQIIVGENKIVEEENMIRFQKHAADEANTRVCIRQCRIWVSLLVCLVVNITIVGQEVKLPDARDLSEHGITEADLSGLDKIMTDFINTGTISGCSFLVAHRGEVVYRRAHGEFTTDQQVPLASVSKPFAASAIMALVDQGKLDLEKPVED